MFYEVPRDGVTFREVVRRQRGMFTAQQAVAAGSTRETLTQRCRRGELDRLTRGVFRAAGSPPTYLDRVYAEILRLRGTAVASDRTAAFLWGLCEKPPHIELTGLNPTVRSGVRVRVASVSARERTLFEGALPSTTPTRTVLDLPLSLPRRSVARAVGDARVRGLINVPALRKAALAVRGPRAHAAHVVLEILDDGLTDSVLEDLFEALLATAPDIPPLVRQWRHPAWPSPFDFARPEQSVVFELQGARYHATPEQQRRDARKHTFAAAHGVTVLCFTWADVTEEPEWVLSQVRIGLGLPEPGLPTRRSSGGSGTRPSLHG